MYCVYGGLVGIHAGLEFCVLHLWQVFWSRLQQ